MPSKKKTPAAPPVRWAVVGLGNLAQVAVLPAFAHAEPEAQLVGLISSDAVKLRTLQKKYRVEATGGYDALEALILSSRIDAVYVVTPNSEHLAHVERALKAGAHVLCEKPMAMTVADCERMNATARAAERKLMVAYRLHFDACTLDALAIAASGKLGELRAFSSTFSHRVREGDIRMRAETGGGALFDLGPYPLNMARHLFRTEPVEVLAMQRHTLGDRPMPVDVATTAVLRFPDDRVAQFTVDQDAADVSSFRIVGTRGELRVEPAFEYRGPQVHHLTLGGKTKTTRYPARDQFAPELISFSRAIRTGAEAKPSGHEGLADVLVLEALARSASTGRAVRLPPRNHTVHPTRRDEMHRPPVGTQKVVHAPSPSH